MLGLLLIMPRVATSLLWHVLPSRLTLVIDQIVLLLRQVLQRVDQKFNILLKVPSILQSSMPT